MIVSAVDPNAEESSGLSEEGKAEEEERRAKLRLFRLRKNFPANLQEWTNFLVSIHDP